ncbi:MAG: enoyl-CoA hydratase/isomerase family protein [Candidatus Freyarchaeota archaeon]|nr:enoyl-CoA hydratase/isomerase family protein [Candidatus Freyrarchaeum guaymaensis]HDO80226.1 enoyl-CoA hydratase/isomerase family protein [Candidatus Bathyarchaeota archaeon]
MKYETLSVRVEDGVAIITLSRPDKLNALDEQAARELLQSLKECEKDENVKVVVITGEGKAFSAGGDIKGMMKSIEEGNPGEFMDSLTKPLYEVALHIRRMSKLVIASVNGYAMGAGFNLAIACDIVLASEKAMFAQSFIKLGLIPGMGGTYLLTRLIGPLRAGELFYTGRTIDAQEALSLGIVNRVVPHEKLHEETMKLASSLARGPTLALARTKMLLEKAMHAPEMSSHLTEERLMQIESAKTRDYEEGVRSFIEKRSPDFQGE